VSATALLVRKEVRAVGTLWLTVVGGILAGLLPWAQRDLRELGPVFYVFGTLVLGASIVGHEYRYGTMAQLLTHPIARARIFAVKMAVLVAVLATVAGASAVAVFSRFRWDATDREGLIALFALPLAYGLVVAPWLTLKTRNTLAGALFSGALAALLLLGGNWAGWLLFESDGEIDAFKMRVLWSGSAVLCAAAAVALWRAVASLQVSDGGRVDVTIPALFGLGSAVKPRRRHPLLMLAVKDLRLQQLAFVATGLYVLLCLTLWARRASLPQFDDALTAATLIHGLVLAGLMGAFTCAEERVLGTREWQLLQPASARVQFAVKVTVTAALALMLAVGVPALLASLLGTPIRGGPGLYSSIVGFAVLLSGSIYLSSLASSAVAAFFACIPGLMLSVWFMQSVVGRAVYAILMRLHDPAIAQHRVYRPFPRVEAGAVTLIVAALLLLVLHYAFENYRAGDRSPRRAAIQVAVFAAAFAAVCMAAAVAGRVLFV
jgi:ABC-type transport system involved in multi-copper enzyme maturation permease subunit